MTARNLYTRLVQTPGALTTRDTLSLTYMLQKCCEQENNAQARNGLMAFTTQVVQDLQNQTLAPHKLAMPHLLSTFSAAGDDLGYTRFWSWLRTQASDWLSPQSYASVIRNRLYAGAHIDELEDLYQEALDRSAGPLASYHLSHNALLQDRSGLFACEGASINLLQAAIEARLERQDIRNAYLALDTLLRLFPAQNSRYWCKNFISHVPCSDGYIVYQLACRNGSASGVNTVSALSQSIFADPPVETSRDAFFHLRTELHIVDAWLRSKPTADPKVLHIVSKLALSILALSQELSAAGKLEVESLFMVIDGIFRLATRPAVRDDSKMDDVHARLVQLVVSTAGRIQSRQLFEVGLRQYGIALKNGSKLTTDPNVYATVIKSAGYLRSPDVVMASWQDLVDLRHRQGQWMRANDWTTFARACREADIPDYAGEQVLEHCNGNDAESEKVRENVRFELRKPKHGDYRLEVPSSNTTAMSEDKHSTAGDCQQLVTQLVGVYKMLAQDERRDFADSPPPMYIHQPYIVASDRDMHRVYDQLTADPREASTDATSPDSGVSEGSWFPNWTVDKTPKTPESHIKRPAVVSTGYPLGQLRYENWRAMNELLALLAARGEDDVSGTKARLLERRPFTGEELLGFIARLRGINEDELAMRLHSKPAPAHEWWQDDTHDDTNEVTKPDVGTKN